LKILLDTNVIVSAFATRGLCSALFEVCIEDHELIISNSIIAEIKKVLEKKLKAPKSTINEVEYYINNYFIKVTDSDNISICRDKDDNKIISVAANNEVSFLVSGDDDLLVLKEYRGVKIVTPRQFWEVLRDQRG